jgi:hypothetical protein
MTNICPIFCFPPVSALTTLEFKSTSDTTRVLTYGELSKGLAATPNLGSGMVAPPMGEDTHNINLSSLTTLRVIVKSGDRGFMPNIRHL